MARDRSSQGKPKGDNPPGDAKGKEKQQTGTQTTWPAFLDDRFDKLEPYAKVAVIIGAILYFFKHPDMQEGTIRNWAKARLYALEFAELCKEEDGPVSNFFRIIRQPVARARTSMQQGITRQQTAQTQYRAIPLLGRLFLLRRPRPTTEVH